MSRPYAVISWRSKLLKIFLTKFDPKVANGFLAVWILALGLSFTIIDWPELKNFLSYLRKYYKGGSRSKLSDAFLKLFVEETGSKNKLIVDKSDCIALPVDI